MGYDEAGLCVPLTIEEEKEYREYLENEVQRGTSNEGGVLIEKYELICGTSDQTGSQSATQIGTINEDSSSSIKN